MTTFEPARTAADAELELVRVQQVKTAPLIERIVAFGSFECPKHFPSLQAEIRWVNERLEHWEGKRAAAPAKGGRSPGNHAGAGAARRILRDLTNLHRYESRAVTRRDRAIRTIALRSYSSSYNLKLRNQICFFAKRTQFVLVFTVA